MTATSNPVLLECQDGVARIRFNRPEALNAIDQTMAESLRAICRELAGSQDLRVIVLSGQGTAFMAGGDLAQFRGDKGRIAQTAQAIIKPLNEALTMLAAMPQLVVAGVHGSVAGAGVSLMLAADLCIAAAGTQFNLAYSRIGASPDASASWSLPRVVGLRKALELTLLAETFDAEEALRLGIVNRVVPARSLAEETDILARRLSIGPGFAYGQTKRLLRTSHGKTLEEQLDAELEAFCACAGTDDFTEGLEAFFEKRRPVFQGS